MACVFFSLQASAQIFAEDACDPAYYESLEARAWLEAQREITQNQNLIFKPDSVLEYSCYDDFLLELSEHAIDMFSQSPRWGTPAGNMPVALTALIYPGLLAYDTANFNHRPLGGRSTLDPYEFDPPAPTGDYGCNRMNQVWNIAKCMDFIDQTEYEEGAGHENDGFFTFTEYAESPDKRFLPTACGGGAEENPDYADRLNQALVNDETGWTEDLSQTFLSLLYPDDGECEPELDGDGAILVSKIPTGLIVNSQVETSSGPVTRYSEYICVVPGCYYEPRGNNTSEYDPRSGPEGRCMRLGGG